MGQNYERVEREERVKRKQEWMARRKTGGQMEGGREGGRERGRKEGRGREGGRGREIGREVEKDV